MVRTLLALSGFVFLLMNVSCEVPAPSGAGDQGARVVIEVAPLNLDGVTNAAYTVTVTNGPDGSGEVVWQATALESDRFGDGAGSLSYVGSCDASNGGASSVTVELTALYEGEGVPIDGGTYQNPTPITRNVTCVENQDVSVVFDMTIVRDASQGFFDVAVDFEDVFCSAKLDCVRSGTTGDLELLHNPLNGNERDLTAVLAFACTPGPEAALTTYLYMDDPIIRCTGAAMGGQDVTFPIDGRGNVDVGAATTSNPGGYLFGAAVYRGTEELLSKAYWNVAFGLNDAAFGDAQTCVLTARATASSVSWPLTPDGFPLPEGAVYPVIEWNVPLTDADGRVCDSHQVNGGDGVSTVYLGYLPALNQFTWSAGPVYLANRYDAAADLVSRACRSGFYGPDCAPCPCVHGTCDDGHAGDGSCTCTDGYWGESCEEAPVDCSTSPCQNGGACAPGPDAGFTCDCAVGFEGETCATNIDDCAASPCLNGGVCTDGVASFTCACADGFSGDTCATDIDDCAASPCLNGGVCTDGVASFTCACADGFSGDTCATDIDDCTAGLCLNGGVCVDGVNTYTCDCTGTGFDGASCDNNIDDCTAGLCLNGGVCVDGVNSTICECAPDFYGDTCEAVVNDCDPNPCLNGGACTDGVATFTCACAAGFEGDLCQTNIDDCDAGSCDHGGTCIDGVNGFTCVCPDGYGGATCATDLDDCSPNPCLNGGACVDGVNAFTCGCAPGFTGATCATDVDECAGAPCLNGGVCNDGVNSFTCACAAGFEGDTCAVEINECDDAPCLNGAVCTDGVASFTCECAPGFMGDTCETDVDVCAAGTSGCDPLAACTDGPGLSFTCGACPNGTTRNARDTFSDGNLDGWTVTDNGTYPSAGAPSDWNVSGKVLYQDNQVGGPTGTGTLATFGSAAWTDLTVSVAVDAGDIGGVGLVVRRASEDTYYAFVSYGQGSPPAAVLAVDPAAGSGETLFVRVEGGEATVLWSTPFARPWNLTMSVTAAGDTFTLSIDDNVLGTVTDAAIPNGSIGLFTSFCAQSSFDDVVVEPATNVGAVCTPCQVVYDGGDCTVEIDECAPEPCQNGGTCTDGLGAFTCACAPGFSGDTCETDVDECMSDNGGCDPAVTCVDRPGPPAQCGDCPDDTTRVLRDDFEDGDIAGWTVTNLVSGHVGGWSWKDGALHQAANVQDTIATVGSPYWTDVTVSATLTSDDDDSLGLVVRRQSADTFYGFSVRATGGNAFKYVGGVKTGLGSFTAGYTTGVPFALSVQAVGATFTVSLDGDVIATVTDSDIPFGAAGAFSRVNAGSYFDDFVVTPANTDGVLCSPCAAGLEGPECSVDIDECASAPCAYGACGNTFGGFACDCQDGWTGATCAVPVCDGTPCDDGDPCTVETCDAQDYCVSAPKCDAQCEAATGACYSCDDLTEGFESDTWLAGQDASRDWAAVLSSPVSYGGYTVEAQGGTRLAAAAGATGDGSAYRSLRVDQAAAGAVVIRLPQPAGRVALTVWTDDVGDPASPAGHTLVGGDSSLTFAPAPAQPEVVTLDLAAPSDTLTLTLAQPADGPRRLHLEAIAYEPVQCADACVDAPCVNGGICDTGAVPAACACPAGWTGPTCADDVDECADAPCLNGGSCANGTATFACACPDGWTGDRCETATCTIGYCAEGDACTSVGCASDGACVLSPVCETACDPDTGACATCDALYLDFEDDAWPSAPAAAAQTGPTFVAMTSPALIGGHELTASADGAVQAATHVSGDPQRYRAVAFSFSTTTIGVAPAPATIRLPQPAGRVGLTLPPLAPGVGAGATYRLAAAGDAGVIFGQGPDAVEVTLALTSPTDTLFLTLETHSSGASTDTLVIDGIGHEPGACTADPCAGVTCDNGGVCVAAVGYGRCDCPTGWIGTTCALTDPPACGFDGSLCACGDGEVDPGEACDDGNTESSDGCRADCAGTEICGDGQLDPGEACDTTAPGPPAGSPSDTAYFGDHVYQWVNPDPELGWEAAKAHCEGLGGYLATITSAEEQAAVASIRSGSPRHRWIGLTLQDHTVRWVTGEPVEFTRLTIIHTSPNSRFGRIDPPVLGSDWTLTALSANPFICEFDAGACSANCGATCGDGIREGAESCDDGFRNGTWDHCLADCSGAQVCGNGVVEPGELCDDGVANGLVGACNTRCGLPLCGDGVVQDGEACDDGALVGEGYCLNDCSGLQTCGDGLTQGSEACDDGALNGTFDRCVADCSAMATCGDGVIQASETCDDGANTGELGSCWPDCRPVVPCLGVLDVAPCDDGDPCTSDRCSTDGRCLNEPACADGCLEGVGTCYACDDLTERFESDDWLAGLDATSDEALVLASPATFHGYTFEVGGATLLAAAARATGDASAYRSLLVVQHTGESVVIGLPAPALRVAVTLWTDDPSAVAAPFTHTLSGGGSSESFNLAVGQATTVTLELAEPSQTVTLQVNGSVDGDKQVHIDAIAYETPLCAEDQCDQCEHSTDCVDGLGAPICSCVDGWTGPTCADDIDECADAPCLNGGTCNNTDGGFSCSCPAIFDGDLCETRVCTAERCDDGDPCTVDSCDEDLGCVYSAKCAEQCEPTTGVCAVCAPGDLVVDFEDAAWPTEVGADETVESITELPSPFTFDGHIFTAPPGGVLGAWTYPSADPAAFRALHVLFQGVGTTATIRLPQAADRVTLTLPPASDNGVNWGALFRLEAGGSAVEFTQSDATQDVSLTLATLDDTVTLTVLNQINQFELASITIDAVRHERDFCAICGDGVVDPHEVCDPGTVWPEAADADATLLFGGHQLALYTAATTWQNARDACLAKGGYLASVHSVEENAALVGLANATTWFGLRRVGSGFEWTSGEPFSYEQPINLNSNTCGVAVAQGQWGMHACSNNRVYVCEFNAGGCAASCQAGVCGNGVVTRDEVCDDGALNGLPGQCRADCSGIQSCGDGVVDDGEACDDGDVVGEGSCAEDCSGLQTCGDGVVQGDEPCDDGNDIDTDACTQGCVLTFCGDGVVQSGEVCDAGEGGGTLGQCRSDCSGIQTCGDGVVDGDEVCDDGNLVGEGYCANDCTGVQTCGDGLTTGSERCDDGVMNGLFGYCTVDCAAVQTCGDGIIQPGEVCDAGAANGTPGTCWSDCSVTFVCGDGYVVGDEVCDDGNLLDGDGCRADCAGFEACGDGLVDVGETCDDGALNGDDGQCTPLCDGVQVCGNQVAEGTEACDDGDLAGEGACVNDCSGIQRCQDGVMNGTEDCDDGNAVAGDGCRADCTAELCGDGIVDLERGEICDDGADNGEPEACTSDCDFVVECGDGAIDWPEACDDGALNGTAGYCAADCSGRPSCGDGVMQGSETCDPGATKLAFCEHGMRIVAGGALFCFVTVGENANEARNRCKAAGGDLATLTSSQNEAVKGFLALRPQLSRLWFGIYRTGYSFNYVYKWMSGASLSYTDWLSGQPTSTRGTISAAGWSTANNPDLGHVCELPNPCGPHCTAGSCGDGVRDAWEYCDEGADNGTGAGRCAADCSHVQTCGDGILAADLSNEPELCDAGALNGEAGYCNTTCDGYLGCGDGVVEGTETCDEGAGNGMPACTAIGGLIDGRKFCTGPAVTAFDQIEAACAEIEGGVWARVDATVSGALGLGLGSEVALALRRTTGCPDPFNSVGPCCDNLFIWPDGSTVPSSDPGWATDNPIAAHYGGAFGTCQGGPNWVAMQANGKWKNLKDFGSYPALCEVTPTCDTTCRGFE